MPNIQSLPRDILDRILRPVAATTNDTERAKWWKRLNPAQREYAEWPIDEDDYYNHFMSIIQPNYEN